MQRSTKTDEYTYEEDLTQTDSYPSMRPTWGMTIIGLLILAMATHNKTTTGNEVNNFFKIDMLGTRN